MRKTWNDLGSNFFFTEIELIVSDDVLSFHIKNFSSRNCLPCRKNSSLKTFFMQKGTDTNLIGSKQSWKLSEKEWFFITYGLKNEPFLIVFCFLWWLY